MTNLNLMSVEELYNTDFKILVKYILRIKNKFSKNLFFTEKMVEVIYILYMEKLYTNSLELVEFEQYLIKGRLINIVLLQRNILSAERRKFKKTDTIYLNKVINDFFKNELEIDLPSTTYKGCHKN